MNRKRFLHAFVLLSASAFFTWPFLAVAETINIQASSLLPHVRISLSPQTGSFVEGSVFQVPILLNTEGRSVNSVSIKINFDKNKLAIVEPSNGVSIIGMWVKPPVYDNTQGMAQYVGVIPNGIVTESGLIGSITFKALSAGQASVTVGSDSTLLLNDGLGTEAIVDTTRASYTLLPKAPEGVSIFSETHPFQNEWYNNNSPVVSWVSDPGVDGFSYLLDDKPSTVPDSFINATGTTKFFDKLKDGLWYFHIKAHKNGVWGAPGHFLVRIDTTPPAEFKISANYFVAATIIVERTLVSFFTTDNLSGIDHYEVGMIDRSQPTTESPLFVEAQSPFQVPLDSGTPITLIVRAFDKAGNSRDESLNIKPPFIIVKFIQEYITYILLGIILAGLFALIFHYLFGHHILRHLRRAFKIAEDEDKVEQNIRSDNFFR